MAYRVKQFASAFTVHMRPEEWTEVKALLRPEELGLFCDMSRSALRHGLQVHRHLIRQGAVDRDLLVAALLHDVGKRRVTLAHRVTAVLLEAAMPRLLDRLALPQGPRWRQGFHEHRHHAEIGAELARGAGCHSRVVYLIQHHHEDGRQDPPGLAALRAADEDN